MQLMHAFHTAQSLLKQVNTAVARTQHRLASSLPILFFFLLVLGICPQHVWVQFTVPIERYAYFTFGNVIAISLPVRYRLNAEKENERK